MINFNFNDQFQMIKETIKPAAVPHAWIGCITTFIKQLLLNIFRSFARGELTFSLKKGNPMTH